MSRPSPIIAVLRTRCGCERQMKWPEFADIIKLPLRLTRLVTWDDPADIASTMFDCRTFEYKGERDLPYVYYEEV